MQRKSRKNVLGKESKPMSKKPTHPLRDDTVLIYHSREDDCWIAHSLRTDQIGTGDGIVNAVADAIKAISQVFELAAQDRTLDPYREAPPHILLMAKKAKPLPREFYEIAHLRALGKWPEGLEGDFTSHDDDKPLKIEVTREATSC